MAKEYESIIQLNGQRYNARTGNPVDGISANQHKNTAEHKTVQTDKKPHSARSTTTSKSVHKTTQPSRTLMRRAVKKPSLITSRNTVAMDVVPHASGMALKQVFHKPLAEREERARTVPKLALVSRFGDMTVRAKNHVAKPLLSGASAAQQQVQAVSNAVTPSSMFAAPKSTQTSRMLDKGLRNADSHSGQSTKKTKLHHRIGRRLGLSARITSISAGVLAFALLGGFFAYQNIPNLNVRYAAAKAGVDGRLPAYKPSGFAVNSHVIYSPGSITIAYKANADSRSYTLTQANTSWSSDALKDHLTTTTGSQLQTYPQKGQTIYLHDGNQADWVDNGVWYSVSGNSSLNTDQLIKIASSI